MKRKSFLSSPISIIFLASLLTFQTTLAYWNVTGGAASDIFLNIQIGEWTAPSEVDKPIGSVTIDEYDAIISDLNNDNWRWQVIFFEDKNIYVLVTANYRKPANLILTENANGIMVFGLTWVPYPANEPKYDTGSVVIHEGNYYRAPRTMWEDDVPGTGTWMPWELLDINNMAYSNSETYELYDVVTYNGHFYQIQKNDYITAANNNAPGTVPYSWQQLDGFYSETNVYNVSDIIVYQNTVYRSLQNNNLARSSDLSNPDKWVKYEN